jgi:flagellar L-ring protein precursor FlgH
MALVLALVAAPARAQNPPAAAATPAAADTARALSPAPPARRADWLSDRLPLRAGDVLTILVEERASAREQVSTVASGQRGLRADLNAGLTDEDVRLGPAKSLKSGLANDSRDLGEARRQGDLVAVLTVRVLGFEGGLARVRGAKQVTVDGRAQEVVLEGTVRPEDVAPDNTVRSGRVADAVILYRGKKLSPRTGLAGRLLGFLWP